jgi:hypothetical protein
MIFLLLFFVMLNKEVTASADHADMPVISLPSNKQKNHIGYGIYTEHWTVTNYVCRIHFNKPAVIKAKTNIKLTGEFEIEKLSSGMICYRYFVSEPPEIDSICCGKYINYYTSILGTEPRLVRQEFPQNIK